MTTHYDSAKLRNQTNTPSDERERDEARGLIRHLRHHVVEIVDAGEFWYARPEYAGGYAFMNESHVPAFKAEARRIPHRHIPGDQGDAASALRILRDMLPEEVTDV